MSEDDENDHLWDHFEDGDPEVNPVSRFGDYDAVNAYWAREDEKTGKNLADLALFLGVIGGGIILVFFFTLLLSD